MQNKRDPRKVVHVSNQGEGTPESVPQQGGEQQAVPSASARRAADIAYAHQLQRERQEQHMDQAAHDYDEMPPEGKKRRKKSGKGTGKKRKRRIWPWVLLAILVIGLGIGVKFYVDITNRQALFHTDPVTTPVLEETPEAVPTQTQSIAPTPTPTPDPEAVLLSQADLEFMKNRVNILVLGVDESTERENWGSFRTDTMILVTINFDTNDVDMISIPRDSYVKICGSSGSPTGKFNKINSAFSAGGGAQKNGYLYSMNTVSHLLGGIPVNYYVGFNMNVVKQVVDAMGGVDYDVDVEINMNGRHLDTGYQHLDGQAVLDYCRQRKGDSDIKRVGRQQMMLKAIFQQLKSTGQIANIPQIYQAVEQNVQTNLTFTQISSLALLAMQMDFDQLNSHTVEGTGLTVGSSSCWGLYMSKLKSLISDVFGISVSLDQDMDVGRIKEQLQAAQSSLAVEISAANSAISTADGILSQYGDWLADDTKSQLKNLRDTLKDAVDEVVDADESRPILAQYTASLQQLNQAILQQLSQYGQGGVEPSPQEPQIPEVEEYDIPIIPEEELPG